MKQIIFICFLFVIINPQPILAQAQPVQIKTNLTFFSKKFLGTKNKIRYSNIGLTKIDLGYDFKNLTSQLSFNYNGDRKHNFDGSYLQHSSGIITFGIGSIERHWSFSKNTSLILSQNARPTKSIYMKLENELNYDWLPSDANWSFEAFNGLNDGALKHTRSMIAGVRAILTPFDALKFELVQTSQWGGKGHSSDISALGAALFFDSNAGSNSNINKMAGFGVSYTMPTKTIPLRIYSQAIGEDEAGSLPSCFAYLAGLEWTNSKIKYPTTIAFEAIDTRIDTTTNGHCGPNTMYNNSIYDYTNYGKTMGAEIDTEGTSLGIHVHTQISQEINIKLATKSVVINDNNWPKHRLSSKRKSGLVNSLIISWARNNIKLNGDIYHQSISLNRANLKSGYGVGFSISTIF